MSNKNPLDCVHITVGTVSSGKRRLDSACNARTHDILRFSVTEEKRSISSK